MRKNGPLELGESEQRFHPEERGERGVKSFSAIWRLRCHTASPEVTFPFRRRRDESYIGCVEKPFCILSPMRSAADFSIQTMRLLRGTFYWRRFLCGRNVVPVENL